MKMNHAHRSQLRDQENPNPKEPQMLLVTHDVPAEDSGSDTSAPPKLARKTNRRKTAATNYTAFFQGSGESSDNCEDDEDYDLRSNKHAQMEKQDSCRLLPSTVLEHLKSSWGTALSPIHSPRYESKSTPINTTVYGRRSSSEDEDAAELPVNVHEDEELSNFMQLENDK